LGAAIRHAPEMIGSVDDDFAKRLDDITARHERIAAEMAEPDVTSDHDRLRSLGKAFAELDEIVVPYRDYRDAIQQAADAREMASAEHDSAMVAFLEDEAEQAEARAAGLRSRLESLLVPKDPNDGKDLIVEIRAGAGGQEAALWAGELYEMYLRLAERHHWKTDVLSSSPSDLGGFKEAVIEVRGRDAYGRLKHESGVHRVQRVPVTESSGRIHTSTATVAVLPEAEEVEVEIRPEDLVIDVYRSSGPGGQSVNTTDSAVRIVHLPTGIKIECQEERSQLQNREKAMRYLRARLLRRAQEEAAAKEAAARRSQLGSGDRSEKIRTYNFPDARVTDHRIKHTSHQLTDVLAGGEELDGFGDRLNAAERSQELAHGLDEGSG
jgi:peptide chain release factor 1